MPELARTRLVAATFAVVGLVALAWVGGSVLVPSMQAAPWWPARGVPVQYQRCGSGEAGVGCMRRAMAASIDLADPLPALSELDRAQLHTDCHVPAHDVGRRWVARPGTGDAEVRAMLATADPGMGARYGTCTRGFVHGIAEALDGERFRDPAAFAAYAARTCAAARAGAQATADCHHGLGHRLVATGLARGQANDACMALRRPHSVDCWAGVKMQLEAAGDART